MLLSARPVLSLLLWTAALTANAQRHRSDNLQGTGYVMTNIPDMLRLQPSLTIGALVRPKFTDSLLKPREHFIELTTTYIPWGYLISVIELSRTDVMDHVIATRLIYKRVRANGHYFDPVLSGRYGFYTLSERLEANNFVTTGSRYYQSAQQFGIGLGFQNGRHRYGRRSISDIYWGLSLSFNYTMKTVHWVDNGRTIIVYDTPKYENSFKVVPQIFLGWRFGRAFTAGPSGY